MDNQYMQDDQPPMQQPAQEMSMMDKVKNMGSNAKSWMMDHKMLMLVLLLLVVGLLYWRHSKGSMNLMSQSFDTPVSSVQAPGTLRVTRFRLA